MNIVIIDLIVKYFIFYVYTYLILIKAINFKSTKQNIFIIIILNLCLGFIYAYVCENIAQLAALLLTFLLFTAFLIIITKKNFVYAFICSLFSITISHFLYFIAAVILMLTSYNIFKTESPTFWDYRVADLLALFFTLQLCRIKRFKYGLAFLKDEEKIRNFGFTVIPLGIFTVMLFLIYSSVEYGNIETESLRLLLLFLMIATCLLIVLLINRERRNYLRHKGNVRTIENLQLLLNEKDDEIKSLRNIAKENHRINHELDILKNKYGIKEANFLSERYKKSIKKNIIKSLISYTDIPEIDDVLNYMNSECDKNKISFIVKSIGSINYMIEKYIPKDKLATLLSDHIKDAIIAIRHSKNSNKSITVLLGELGANYGICIHDTGIEFKIDTLINLGIKPITTHPKTGGTGFGFMTTFETLKITNASLLITENKPNSSNYTKSISVLFDGKKEYRINSYRNKKIYDKDITKRILLVDKN